MMKASFTFREEKTPLFRAKVALTTLGLPFQSSLAAGGDSNELSFGFGTFFNTGPAFRVSYRPNDSYNPLSLLVKTGLGRYGSPIDAPMTISAEFNLLSGSMSNPTFFLHFKPRIGDFSLRKLQSSETTPETKRNDVVENAEEKEGPAVERALAGMMVAAKTVLPIQNVAVLKLRWGVTCPEGCENLTGWGRSNPTAGIPLLTLHKIGIEHVANRDNNKKRRREKTTLEQRRLTSELVDTCFTVKRQLETLRAENSLLGKALDEVRMEIANKNRGQKK